jgi:hypothetical protein
LGAEPIDKKTMFNMRSENDTYRKNKIGEGDYPRADSKNKRNGPKELQYGYRNTNNPGNPTVCVK